jgi:ribose-phosphate pyrophosphokinase
MAILVLSGRASSKLGNEIAQALGVKLGQPSIAVFSDGEPNYSLAVDITGQHVVIVQATPGPVQRNYFDLWGLLGCIQNLIEHGQHPASVIVVLGFMGFRRQERATVPGEAVMAKIMAEFLKTLPVTHVILVDPHARENECFFDPLPVRVVDALPAKVRVLREIFCKEEWGTAPKRVICPDTGREDGTACLAEALGFPLIRYNKRRPSFNETHVTGCRDPGTSVAGCLCIINDDEMDTGRTSMDVGQLLVEAGALGLFIVVTHGVLSGNAFVNIVRYPDILGVAISNTVYLPWEKRCEKIVVYSVVPEIVPAIRACMAEAEEAARGL